jgi:predicted MFS family arabinose efflux permease
MSPTELRASVSLASIYALRMLGLFLVLPVFAVHARGMPGGDSGWLVGLALGVYGLTQSLLQIPYGAASDRLGRKPVIVVGLAVLTLGSFVAAAAQSVEGLALGRALQGAGAVSAAVTAFIADSTRDEHRSKAMAMVGASIALTFAVSMAAGPSLYGWIGLDGMFGLTGILAVAAIGVVLWVVPAAPPRAPAPPAAWSAVLRDAQLLRLNAGVFALHAAQIALFAVVPALLVERAGLPAAEHWKVYVPVILGSFVFMMPPILAAERRGKVRLLFLGAIGTMAVVLALAPWLSGGLWPLGFMLFAFFVAFNVLEALQPSLVSRLAPAGAKGLALGVYNTTQGLGFALGGVLGGVIYQRFGSAAVFEICAVIVLAWLATAWGMRPPARKPAAAPPHSSGEPVHGLGQ